MLLDGLNGCNGSIPKVLLRGHHKEGERTFIAFLHAPIKKKIPPFWATTDALQDTLLDLTRIQWVTGFVLSADLGHAVRGLHI